MFHPRNLISLLLALSLTALLAGCGGGGGGGNGGGGGGSQNNLGSISGKVVDTTGNPVASAIVFLDGQAVNTGATYQQGGYLLTNVTPGFHVVSVSTTVGGVTETGATDFAEPNISQVAATNGNIIVSPAATQAVISGYVYYSDGVTPVPGARVVFQTAFAANPSGAAAGTVGIVAITDNTGYYQLGGGAILNSAIPEPGIPTLDTRGGTSVPRNYTITASIPPVNGTTYANAPTVTRTFTANASVLAANANNFTLPVSPALAASGTTPAINYLLSFTQPDVPAYYPPQVLPASADAVYEQVRRALAPKYAQLVTSEHAAAAIKHIATRTATAHAAANQYTIEMDLFFSLPGDSGSVLSPARSELAGFNIYNNANQNAAASQAISSNVYDFLEDPLANFYTDPDLGANGAFYYNEDQTYQFAVQGVGVDEATTFALSPIVSVEPLSLVNLAQPSDPNDSNGAITTLAADPTFTWTTVDASQTTVPNNRVRAYTVFIYSTFPGVTTTPIYQSSALTPSSLLNATTGQETFTPPGTSLAAGEYWVVVAATADDSTATAGAVSVSQITPFTVP